MKYIRTLKNIEKLMNARPNYVTRQTLDGIEFVNYRDTAYDITVEIMAERMDITLDDRHHPTQRYTYFKTTEGWEYDKYYSRVNKNKEVNLRLRSDLMDIEDGNYRATSWSEYDLSKNDAKTIIDMVYSFTTDERVAEIANHLYEDLDDLDARIVYKHKTVDEVKIISSNGQYALTYYRGEWNAYDGGMRIRYLQHIPSITDYIIYNTYYKETLENDRVRPLPETETAAPKAENNDQIETVVDNDQTFENNDQAQVSIKKWPIATTSYQPHEIHNETMLAHDRASSQVLTGKRAPPRHSKYIR